MLRKRTGLLAAVALVVVLVPPGTADAAGVPGEPIHGDVTGDGISDRSEIIFRDPAECGIRVEPGDGFGGYGPPTDHYFPVPGGAYGQCPDMGVVLDLGGDGTVEYLLAWFSGPPDGVTTGSIVLRGFQVVGGFRTVSQPQGIGVADFDGDGRQDVYFWSDQGSGLSTYLNTAAGELVLGRIHWDCIHTPDFEFADFDGDGATDVLLHCAGGNAEPPGVVVLLDDGSVVRLHTAVHDGEPTWTIGVVDADADGTPDVVTTNDASGEVTHFINDGSGGFTPAPLADDDTARTRGSKKVDIRVLDNDVSTTAGRISIVTPPRYGTLQITSRRTVVYKPNGIHTRSDKFVYRLTVDGKSDIAGVTVRVAN